MLRNNESRYSQINDVIDMVNNKKDDFDYSLALEYMGNNEKVLMNIISSFLNYNKDSISLMKEYLRKNDGKELFAIFHHFKGVSLNLGSRIMYSFSDYLCEKFRYKQNESIDTTTIEEIKLYIEFCNILFAKLESVRNEHK